MSSALRALCSALCAVEDFYDSIGGLVGYQRQCLELIVEQQAQQGAAGSGPSGPSEPSGGSTQFLVPPGIDLSGEGQSAHAAAAALAGLEAVPSLAEIYPLGGAGDRLGLACESTGESLPTAVLQYCGRSLLEALVRDLQVRAGSGGGG